MAIHNCKLKRKAVFEVICCSFQGNSSWLEGWWCHLMMIRQTFCWAGGVSGQHEIRSVWGPIGTLLCRVYPVWTSLAQFVFFLQYPLAITNIAIAIAIEHDHRNGESSH